MLLEVEVQPLYQQVAREALHLRELGLSYCAIASKLGADDKTVAKAIRWLRRGTVPGSSTSHLSPRFLPRTFERYRSPELSERDLPDLGDGLPDPLDRRLRSPAEGAPAENAP